MPSIDRVRSHVRSPSRFSGFENDHYVIFLGVLKVRIDKVITPSLRGIQNGRAPFLAPVLYPVLKKFEKIIVDV